jgi:5-methylcytosine-specific restriction endonuclease McrA
MGASRSIANLCGLIRTTPKLTDRSSVGRRVKQPGETMPIKQENKHRYPKDWKQIRERILARAGNCCEKCKAPNHTRIARGAGKDVDTYQTSDADVYCAESGQYLGRCHMGSYDVLRYTDVVLTIAHLDHMPENCADDNLRAWCQRCHLRYDADHHKRNAQATRRKALRTADLFDAV